MAGTLAMVCLNDTINHSLPMPPSSKSRDINVYYKPEKGDTWYIPEGKESRQLNMIAEQMEYMKKVRAKKEAEWDEADKQYKMFLEERPKEEWRSQLKLPTTFAIVETAGQQR